MYWQFMDLEELLYLRQLEEFVTDLPPILLQLRLLGNPAKLRCQLLHVQTQSRNCHMQVLSSVCSVSVP